MTDTEHGFRVLADISGFTAFVTATELEHGPPIIAALLNEVIARIAPPLEVLEVEGDAVFALGVHGTVVPPATLLDVLHGGFVGFRERQRELEMDASCSCNACRNVWRLRSRRRLPGADRGRSSPGRGTRGDPRAVEPLPFLATYAKGPLGGVLEPTTSRVWPAA